MDKLVEYVEFRKKKYGSINCTASSHSMYYQFGELIVRISDHLKYGEKNVKTCDYYFIIQPNNTYIFLTGPKYNKDNKLYMRVVGYEEAKEFIRAIHEYTLKFFGICNWYSPCRWNGDSGNSDSRLTFDEFKERYFNCVSDTVKWSIINKMESLVYGKLKKGSLEEKVLMLDELYNSLSQSQYETLIGKLINIK